MKTIWDHIVEWSDNIKWIKLFPIEIMPYFIIKKSGPKPWKIIKRDTGEEVGSSATKEDAQASIRARYAAENKNGKKNR